jgi:hypothetical protein
MSIGAHSLKNLLGEARAAAVSIHTNPRNREHNWYPFWHCFVLMLMHRIIHRSMLASQFPVWRFADTKAGAMAGQVSTEEEADNRSSESSGDPIEVDEAEHDEGSYYGSDGDMEMEWDGDEDDISFSSGSGTISEKTRQRITDFAVLMWDTYSPFDSEEEESSEEDDSCDNTTSEDEMLDSGVEKSDDSDTPRHNDIISPPLRSELMDTIKEYVAILVEVKRYPPRRLKRGEWSARLLDGMTKARTDVVRQVNLPVSLSHTFNAYKLLILGSGLLLIQLLTLEASRSRPPHCCRGRLLGICGAVQRKGRQTGWETTNSGR